MTETQSTTESTSITRFLEAVALTTGLPKKHVEQMFLQMRHPGVVAAAASKTPPGAAHKRKTDTK